jgi:HAD superfamily hydrolase (TIGR01549 family)
MALCERAATRLAPSPFFGMLASLGLNDAQLDEVKSSVSYGKSGEKLYPGVAELLASLSSRFKLGVIANQSAGTEERLTSWGLRDHFSLVFASTELGLSKPDPRIFAAASEAAQCTPAEAVMVGDRLDNDIGPAKAQGWRTVRVLQGFSRFQRARGPHELPDGTFAHIQDLSVPALIGLETP